jgi:hypothetical protein
VSIDLRALDRLPFPAGRVVSGATFERAVLSDGSAVVLKHLPADGDWLTRFTRGEGRARHLWESGVLGRAAAVVDHAVVDVAREDDHDVVVMRDVGASLLPRGDRLPAETVDDVLRGLASLHQAFEGCELGGLCTPADRHRIAAPAFHRADIGPNPCPFSAAVLHGWDHFGERVPADVASAIFAVLEDPAALGRELESVGASTLLHGDAKLGNVGLGDGRLVLIDWGELTSTGPAELDLTWLAATATTPPQRRGTWAIDAMPDELFRRYVEHAGGRVDPRALDLACIGQLAQQGFILAAFIAHAPDSAGGSRCSRLLDWWTARVRTALDAWSPT